MTDSMQRAVEAMAVSLLHGGCEPANTMAAGLLTAALPHLEAHFREKIAGEVERDMPPPSMVNWVAATKHVAKFIREAK